MVINFICSSLAVIWPIKNSWNYNDQKINVRIKLSFTISCSSVSIFFGANLTMVRSFIINFVYKWEIFITCFFMVNNGSQRINLFTMLASGFGFVVEINLRVIQFITRIIFKSSYFLNVWIIFIFNNSCFRLFIIIINLSCFDLFIKKTWIKQKV